MKGGTLSASIVTGEGKVTLSQEFMDSNAVFKKDILQDWVYELVELYNSFDCAGNEIEKEKAA